MGIRWGKSASGIPPPTPDVAATIDRDLTPTPGSARTLPRPWVGREGWRVRRVIESLALFEMRRSCWLPASGRSTVSVARGSCAGAQEPRAVWLTTPLSFHPARDRYLAIASDISCKRAAASGFPVNNLLTTYSLVFLKPSRSGSITSMPRDLNSVTSRSSNFAMSSLL